MPTVAIPLDASSFPNIRKPSPSTHMLAIAKHKGTCIYSNLITVSIHGAPSQDDSSASTWSQFSSDGDSVLDTSDEPCQLQAVGPTVVRDSARSVASRVLHAAYKASPVKGNRGSVYYPSSPDWQ